MNICYTHCTNDILRDCIRILENLTGYKFGHVKFGRVSAYVTSEAIMYKIGCRKVVAKKRVPRLDISIAPDLDKDPEYLEKLEHTLRVGLCQLLVSCPAVAPGVDLGAIMRRVDSISTADVDTASIDVNTNYAGATRFDKYDATIIATNSDWIEEEIKTFHGVAPRLLGLDELV